MKVNSKKEINLTNLKANDELVTYSVKTSSHVTCVKMRKIGGKNKFILDTYCDLFGFSSKTYNTMTELKSNIEFCHHW